MKINVENSFTIMINCKIYSRSRWSSHEDKENAARKKKARSQVGKQDESLEKEAKST